MSKLDHYLKSDKKQISEGQIQWSDPGEFSETAIFEDIVRFLRSETIGQQSSLIRKVNNLFDQAKVDAMNQYDLSEQDIDNIMYDMMMMKYQDTDPEDLDLIDVILIGAGWEG